MYPFECWRKNGIFGPLFVLVVPRPYQNFSGLHQFVISPYFRGVRQTGRMLLPILYPISDAHIKKRDKKRQVGLFLDEHSGILSANKN